MVSDNKIIILSEDIDPSTTEIMKWIWMSKVPVYRINSNDKNLKISIFSSTVLVRTSFYTISITKNDFCCFRKAVYPYLCITDTTNSLEKEKQAYIFNEKKHSYNSLKSWIINNCSYSSYYSDGEFNKIDVLIKAKYCDILIPEWILTGLKFEAVRFASKYSNIAVKPFLHLIFMTESIIIFH